MHPNVTKQQFIELRAQGLSLSRIADQLHVSKRTLVGWNREHHADIDSLRALELEALHEKLLASHEQELTRLAAYQCKIDEELAKRPLEKLTTDKLFRLSLLFRREIRDLCTQTVRNTSAAHPTENQIKARNAAFTRQHLALTPEDQPLQSQIKAERGKYRRLPSLR